MNPIAEEMLMHYGMPRRSGRYPWGSGDNPYQRSGDFLASAGYVQFRADSEAATRDLYAAYKVWCEDNAENPLSPKSFSGFIAQSADAYRLEATNNVYIGSGKRCRGYLGIEVLIKPTAL